MFLQWQPVSGVSRTAWGLSDPAPDDWHTYEVTTSVTVRPDQGPTRIWLPAPLPQRTAFQRTLSTSIDCPTGKAHQTQNANASMVCAQFPAGAAPAITVTNRVATRELGRALGAAKPLRHLQRAGEGVSRSHALRSHRRHREGARRQHHQRADLRRRQDACRLRVGRREHPPRSQGSRLRSRRHPPHAGDRRPRRKMRRHQRTLRRPGEGLRRTRA